MDATARTNAPFAVVHAAPRGRVRDRLQAGVTVLFSRGMRAIEAGDTERLPAATIRTKAGAMVAGGWRWAGTRGLMFVPDGELPGGADLVVAVPAGTRSLDGALLQHEYSFEFSTDGPRVTDVSAGQRGRTIRTEPVFRLQLDQPVAPDALLAATTLRVYSGDGDPGEAIPLRLVGNSTPPSNPNTNVGAGTSQDAKANTEGIAVTLAPVKALPLDREVELKVAGALRGLSGPRPMGDPAMFHFHTRGPLRVMDFYCPRIEAMGRCRAGGDLRAHFSNPVSPEEFRSHWVADRLPPRPAAKGDKRPRSIEPSETHWLRVSPKLGQEYRVILKAGMKDIYGEKLAEDVAFDVVVEAPLVRPAGSHARPASDAAAADPNAAGAKKSAGITRVAGSSKPAAGTKAAAAAKAPSAKPKMPLSDPSDTRPRRERLPYKLELGVAGNVFEVGTDEGVKSHRIPVGAINIPNYGRIAVPLNEAQTAAWTLTRNAQPDFLTRNSLLPTWVLTDGAENQRAVEFIDLNAGLAPHHGLGPMLLRVAAPSGEGAQEALVTVTDLGVSAKFSPFGGLVWVTHLSTGKPIAGATVAVRSATEGEIVRATTDSDGTAIVPIEKFDPVAQYGFSGGRVRTDAMLVVRNSDDWTFAKIARSPSEARLTSAYNVISKQSHWAGIVFADRGVYRPGETAKVAGVVRVADDAGLRALSGRELRIELKDSSGERVFDGRARSDDFGTFTLDVPIPKTAQLGTGTLTATAPLGGKSNTSESGVFSQDIRILHYKADEFKVTTEADRKEYVKGDTATFRVEGAHLHGGAMKGADVATKVTREVVPFAPEGIDGFVTTDEVFTSGYGETTPDATKVDDESGKLDDEGRFERQVELSFDDQSRPERVVLEATVRDAARREVSARAQALLHPAEFYLGLRLPKDRFAAAGTAVRADVLAALPNGLRRPGIPVRVELVERRWAGVVAEQPDGTPSRTSTAKDIVVGSCNATTTASSAGCELRIPNAGYFVVRATAADARKHQVRASTWVYGTESNPIAQAQAAWPENDTKTLKLEANKKTYDAGETAQFVVRSPFREADALVTVERNGVLARHVVPLKGPLPVVSIPVQASYYPNVYVGIHLVRGRIQPPPAAGADLGGPDFRIGYTELRLNPDAHRLHVDIRSPRAEYAPGQEVDADVSVTGADGKAARSAVTFYAVDEGVLGLTSYKTPDPLPAFVLSRKLSVFSIENREQLARILPLKAGEKFPPVGFEYALAKDSGEGFDKGEAGGGGDDPNAAKRKDFRATAYFEAGRQTDQEGKARFHFKLPDNLTTFRLMAVAAGTDDRFGSGDSRVTTSRPLIAQPALPRQIRVGDSFDASVAIMSKPATSSKTSEAVPVDVKLDVKGLQPTGPTTRKVTLKPGEQVEVRFPVRATAPGEAKVAFRLQSGKDIDDVELTRSVELATSIETSAVYGETSSPAAIRLANFTGMRNDKGGLDVRVASSALVGIGSTLDRLLEYPYGCTEQLVSRTLPLLATMDLGKDFGARLPTDVNAVVDTAFEQILKNQQSDGGFAYWPDGGSSDPWLSAYAMLPLVLGSEQKRFVPRDAIERGREYLASHLTRGVRAPGRHGDGSGDDGEPQGDDDHAASDRGNQQPNEQREANEDAQLQVEQETEKRAKTDYATAAFSAHVLAMIGSKNAGSLNVLYDARKGQRLFAQAALLSAMAKSDMNRDQLSTLAREIEARLRIGAKDVDVDEADYDDFESILDSRARTLAMVLQGLLAVDPHHPLAARLAARLLSLRQNGAWRTTQEDAWALLALSEYHKAQESAPNAFSARVFLGNEEVLEAKFPAGSTREDRLSVAANTLVSGRPDTLSFDLVGQGKLYYSAELRYATTTLPSRPRDEGLFVRKAFVTVDPSKLPQALAPIPVRSAEAVAAGDLVLVDLIFESAENRTQIVLDDPLPTGLEALDYDLDTTAQSVRAGDGSKNERGRALQWLGTTFKEARFRREVRDDRVLTFFEHLDPGMYRVQYLARARTIGSFVVPPTRIECMYTPEAYGMTAAGVLTVKPKG